MPTNQHNQKATDEGLTISRIRNTRWIIGRVGGYRFDALVFAEHADFEEFEIGRSRISKLWVRREADRRTVFNWDRGADIDAADEETRRVVARITENLARLVYGF